jgi:hypothetical protein
VKDPFGQVLTELRADPGIQAIAAQRVGARVQALPCVVMEDISATVQPGGRGNARLGDQEVVYAFRCYGGDEASGDGGRVAARNLAGAVVDFLHERGPRIDGQNRLIHRSWVESMSGVLEDPDERWPYCVVTVSVLAAAQAVA